MKTLKVFLFVISLLFFFLETDAQRKEIVIPDIPGYLSLKGDLHTHTVFSDGYVWPTYRVGEAWRDGLDFLAITDHIEYTPFSADVKKDLARPFEISEPISSRHGLLLVQGVEITRAMPPGHFNALFLDDPEKLRLEEVADVMEEAVRQGAYIFWNHPGWRGQQPDGVVRVYERHREMFERGWVHGVEFGNQNEYYTEVIDIAREHNLALLANSDLHETASDLFIPRTVSHRPLTIIFCKEKSLTELREAMFEQRMVAWIQHILAGSEQWLKSLLKASLKIEPPNDIAGENKWVTIRNESEFLIHLEKEDEIGGPDSITLEPLTSVVVQFPEGTHVIGYKVLNTLTIETGSPLRFVLEIPG
jgi:3',5'-nucleoside bisphosphate phosphatase